MILGVGVDVVDVDRFDQSLRRTPRLRQRLFTAAEQERRLASQAARFAAKEALAKALGAPAGLNWQDAEVGTDEAGRPYFTLSGTVAARADELGAHAVHLSLSHDAGLASAIVVVEG